MTMMASVIGALIGVLVAWLTVRFTRRLQPRHEQLFYALSLIPIALIYIGFCYYYQRTDALAVEWIGVAIFSVFAVLGQWLWLGFLALAYVAHGLWDLGHELYHNSVMGYSWTPVPMGYAVFCVVYDLIVAGYVVKRWRVWLAGR